MMKEFLVSALKRLLMVDKIAFSWYNNSVYKSGAEVCSVEHNYGFLFKKSSLPKSDLNNLLQFDDFVEAANKIMDNGKGIEDTDIYCIVKDIYFPMLKNHQKEGFKELYKAENGAPKYKEWSFKFRTFGNAIKVFSKTLFGSTDQFKADYITYCNQ